MFILILLYLKIMAHKLGKIGGHPKGGHGAKYDGNFYWSKDIFLLFDKKFI